MLLGFLITQQFVSVFEEKYIVKLTSDDNLHFLSRRKPDLPADIEDVSEINVPLLLHVLRTETMKHMCKHGCLDASFSCFGPFE